LSFLKRLIIILVCINTFLSVLGLLELRRHNITSELVLTLIEIAEEKWEKKNNEKVFVEYESDITSFTVIHKEPTKELIESYTLKNYIFVVFIIMIVINLMFSIMMIYEKKLNQFFIKPNVEKT